VIFDSWKSLAEQSSSEINEKVLLEFCQTVNQSGCKQSVNPLIKKLGLWRSTNIQVNGDKSQLISSTVWHEKPEPHQYHPKISAHSKEIDLKNLGRRKSAEPRFKMLLHQGQMYKDKREMQAIEKEEQEVLSFKPDLSKSKSSMRPNMGARKTSTKKEPKIAMKMRERLEKTGDLDSFLK